MKQLKLLLAAGALMLATGISAQTDVTSMYIQNADFASMDGWTEFKSGTTLNIGSGLIGTFKPTGNTAATVDETHLAREYCIGMQNRWNTVASAYQQTTTSALPAGFYELTYDVEDVNGDEDNPTFENLFYVELGSTKYVDSKTEWQNKGKSPWTAHSITFTVDEAAQATISLGYKNTSNKNKTPILYVSHLKLTYTDPDAAAHAAALEAAKYTLGGYIKKATALNGVLADTDLATAIETAQGVYDAADDYADDYDNTVAASTTLNSAIANALNATTVVTLNNGNFDTNPNNTLNADNTTTFGGSLSTATSNPENTKDFSANTGDHGYLYDVYGWTQYSKFNSTASQGTTSQYGTAMPANGWSTNSTTLPAKDMLGSSDGAALHLSAGWGDQARYQQTLTSLPTGRYLIYYEVINQYSNTNIASNYIGVNGNKGDFYGTTNSFVYSDLKTIEQGVWKAQAFEFDVAQATDINLSVGVTTSTSGSGNGAKLWIDNVLVYRLGDIMITDEEADAILASVAELDEAIYNKNLKDALAEAKTTFEAEKTLDNYNALNEALIAAQESVSLYEQIDEALTNIEAWSAGSGTNVAECYRTDYYEGNYGPTGEYDWAPEDFYTYYRGDQVMKLAQNNATDYTSVILNPGFETGDGIGWEYNEGSDTKITLYEGNNFAFTGAEGNFVFNTWGGSTELYIRQTIPGLPAGTYQLSAVLTGSNGADIILSANDFSKTLTVEGNESTGYETKLIFTLDEESDVEISVSNQANVSFFKCDNFKLVVYDEPLADADDYAALNDAIEAAEAKTLGFDEGEYAPYNNIVAIQTIAAAKAIDQEADNPKDDVTAMTTALQNAVWTANTQEVDAIFDGQFATTEANETSGDINLPGWTKVQGIRLLVKDETVDPGLAYTDGKAAVFSWAGTTLTYGEQTGYTLPLNEHEVYELTLKVSAWRDGAYPNWFSVKFDDTTADDVQTVDPKAMGVKPINSSDGNPFVELKFYLTPTESTTKLIIYGNQHFTVADLSLKLATPVEINEAVAYTPENNSKAYVKLTRTIKEGMNTVVLPFELTANDIKTLGGEGAVAYTVSAYANDNLTFETAETVPANTPFFLKAEVGTADREDGKVFTFLDKKVEAGIPEAVTPDGACSLLGSYEATFTVPESDAMQTAYILSGGQFYKVDSPVTIKNTRFYVLVDGEHNANTLGFTFNDGEANAINGVASETAAPEGIYNLQGQKVATPVKGGIYIINGKKVLVK
jgi:hypothetical protein